jgi:hypothetical protein
MQEELQSIEEAHSLALHELRDKFREKENAILFLEQKLSEASIDTY